MRGITAVLQLPFISIVVRFLLGFVHQCGSCRLQWDPESLMCCQMMMLILAFRIQQLSARSFAMLAVWFRFAYGWVAAWSNEKRSIESFLFKDPLLFLKPGFPCPYTFPPLSVYICSRIDSCICFLFKCWLFPVPGPSRKARRLAWQYSRGDPWLQVLEVRRCMLDSAYIKNWFYLPVMKMFRFGDLYRVNFSTLFFQHQGVMYGDYQLGHCGFPRCHGHA